MMDEEHAATSHNAPRCRLQCLLARKSSKAVIFRRGPSRHTCLISWDRATDTFETGQWFKGSVYPGRSDLSADGEWLLVFMGNFRTPLYTWTVLSRPPWFTAVALWPKGDTWGGGGAFLGERDILLYHEETAVPMIGAVPKPFTAHLHTPELNARMAKAMDQNPNVWKSVGEPFWRGPFRRRINGVTLTLTLTSEIRKWGEERAYELEQADWRLSLPDVDWADLDDNGDLLFARGGQLYRLSRSEFWKVEEPEAVWRQVRLLADFTDLRFQRGVRAPYGAPTRRHMGDERAPDGDADAPSQGGFLPSLDAVTREDRRLRRRLRKGGRHS